MARGLIRLLHLLHLVALLECGGNGGRAEGEAEPTPRDMVSENMLRVYERYSKEPESLSQRDGNTVRSFTANSAISHGREFLQFNLTSIPASELVLFASFHFLYRRGRAPQRPWRLRKPRHASEAHPRLLLHGSSSSPTDSATSLGNLSLGSLKKGSWQTIDITAALKQARDADKFVILAELDLGFPRAHERPSATSEPYILVYADDRAIDEPNSVALSLQRYGPSSVGEDSASASRIRRELDLRIHANDIPEVQLNSFKNHELWQNTYFPDKAKTEAKPNKGGGRENSEALSRPEVLSFDDRTMKKARRRQWSEPRVCSRRYLRVDFADIGWSEWVLAPKSFDAYYCAGTCGFPIPKVVRPSNHATIQSIVRAVGIVPGVPEPCCVPEKMRPLTVLFLDQDRNMVLKVYPSMTVDTCACR